MDSLKRGSKKYGKILNGLKQEIKKVVVGQDEIVNALLRALISDGHVLVEGVPGIAKTLLIRAFGKVSGCKTKRIQFTIDLLPTDITGLTIYTKEKGFSFVKGPIFSNFVIADEINRGSPKTQSATLEAMQEKQVTIGKETFHLSPPFLVMATQNPIETAGVNQLPEAQIDRFLFKINMDYPKKEEEEKIMEKNITLKKFEEFNLKAITNPRQIIKMQEFTKKIYISDEIKKYIVEIVRKTREKNKHFPFGKYIEYGASPRAAIGLFIGSKAEALMNSTDHVIPQFVKNVAYDVLRHRIILNYAAQAEGIKTDEIIREILNKIPVP